MTKLTLDQIRTLAEKYDQDMAGCRIDATNKFKELVEQHGVSYVAAASGLAESTVSQYSRCKIIPISEYTLNKIINILAH